MYLATLFVLVIASFIIGSFPFGVWFTRHTGKDPREIGSGNTGAANIIRNFGWKLGIIVLICDVFKGLVPLLAAKYLGYAPLVIITIGLFAILGHCFSPFLKFKGGKGASTALGVVIGLNLPIAGIVAFIWIATIIISRYSSLATLVSAWSLLILGSIFKIDLSYLGFYLLVACFISYKHKDNIKRLLHKEETKINLFAPRKIDTGLKRVEIGNGCEEVAKYTGSLKKNGCATKNWVFLIHALEVDDFLFVESNDRMKQWVNKFKAKPSNLMHSFLKGVGKQVVGEGYIKAKGKTSYGMFVLVPYLPERFQQALEEYKNGKKELLNEIVTTIKEAVELAKNMGAEYTGLGAFTSVITGAGEVLEKEGLGPVTSGNSLTAGGLCQGALDACKKMGINPNNSTVSIIGATGSVGKPTSILMAKHFKNIILCSKTTGKLEKLKKEMLEKNPKLEISIETEVNTAIKNSNVVVMAVSATKREMELDPKSFQKGSVCCDASRPLVIPEYFLDLRKDVLFIEGSIFQFPGFVSCPKLLRMGADDYGFACLVETMLRSLENQDKSGGYGLLVSEDEAEEMLELAKKYNIKLAGHKFLSRQYSLFHIYKKRFRSLYTKI